MAIKLAVAIADSCSTPPAIEALVILELPVEPAARVAVAEDFACCSFGKP